jgi:hypothetical protein
MTALVVSDMDGQPCPDTREGKDCGCRFETDRVLNFPKRALAVPPAREPRSTFLPEQRPHLFWSEWRVAQVGDGVAVWTDRNELRRGIYAIVLSHSPATSGDGRV